MNKQLLGLLLFFVAGSALGQSGAPFCVVYSGGQMCNYYDANSCWSTARSLQGMCAPNSNPQASQMQPTTTSQPKLQRAPASPQPIYPDTFGSFNRGYQAAQEQRLRQAEIKSAELQNKLLQQQLSSQSSRVVDYSGIITDGKSLYSACSYAQSINGPLGQKYSTEESFQSILCLNYVRGAYEAAGLAGRFSSRDGAIQFCSPRQGSNPSELVDAIVSSGKKAPQFTESGADSGSLLLMALASMSNCPVIVK